jgi:hypothetical protein
LAVTGETTEITIAPISGKDLEAIQDRFPARKFFILGYPRSGTTLLARLLRLDPTVHSQWQAPSGRRT